jgi:hypothetical protein
MIHCMNDSINYSGIDPDDLRNVLAHGVDHGGNAIEPFVDHEGGWPLRCCLNESAPGDRVAIIAWSPFDWDGPYREVGPVVAHVDGCDGKAETEMLPTALDESPMVLRPYSHDHRIAYGHVRHVEAGESLTAHVRQLLERPEIAFVHGRNVTGGCYSFTARRGQ